MKNGRKITIKHVADMANVSIATVSRIMNHKGNVKEETRQKVLSVMESLDISPSASLLTDQTSNTILLCVPDFSNPFNSLVIDGIQKAAYANNYRVLILQSKETYLKFEDYESVLREHSFAGLILLTSIADPKLVEDLARNCPIVMCSEYCDINGASFVSIDDIAAARKATEYLIACGCKKIGLLNSAMQHQYARKREDGFRQALEEAGLPVYEEMIAHISSVNYKLALSHAENILRESSVRPDAFFAVSDVFAVAALRVARQNHLRVPQDISVIGFDNIEVSAMTNPPITTIEQPSFQIGYQACQLLAEKICNPSTAPRKIILGTELIARGSTALTFRPAYTAASPKVSDDH